MKTVISGNLAAQPELKDVTKGDKKFKACSGSIYVPDPSKFGKEGQKTEGVAFRFSAYGERAEAICEMEKGTKLTFVGSLRNGNYEKDGTKIYKHFFLVEAIDKSNTLQNEQTQILNEFVKGERKSLTNEAPDMDVKNEEEVNKEAASFGHVPTEIDLKEALESLEK